MTQDQAVSKQSIAEKIQQLDSEIVRVNRIKNSAEFRASRYNEITSRVKFGKKKSEKVYRDLRRLQAANQLVDNAINALNQLVAQREQYSNQLEAV